MLTLLRPDPSDPKKRRVVPASALKYDARPFCFLQGGLAIALGLILILVGSRALSVSSVALPLSFGAVSATIAGRGFYLWRLIRRKGYEIGYYEALRYAQLPLWLIERAPPRAEFILTPACRSRRPEWPQALAFARDHADEEP